MRPSRTAFGLIGLVALCSLAYGLSLRAYVIRSRSMEPTLRPGDVVLAERLSGYVDGPRRDRLYAFEGPRRWYVKRLVGLPRDALALRGRTLYRNGRAVAEPWVRYLDGGRRDMPARVLGEGEHLLLGDSRDRSRDSRELGPVPRPRIGGRVFLRLWPPGRAGRIE